jgi:maltooligosyltrehalose synthase
MNRIDPSPRPVATYRLQFHRDFGFPDARDLAPYLAELGITVCYCSPYLKANPGSRHGYDIGEHGSLNPDLGSEGDYEGFCSALRAHDLGHIVDFVPNNMAADPRSNPWWRDVLENGPSSPFADFFDIDWDPVKPELKDKVLLPVLGDQNGRALERGELQLRFDDGALHLWYFDLDLRSGILVAVVPRLVVPLVDGERLPVGPDAWGTTRIALPPAVRAARYRHVFTGETCSVSGSDCSVFPLETAFRTCPVALLWAPASDEGVQDGAA